MKLLAAVLAVAVAVAVYFYGGSPPLPPDLPARASTQAEICQADQISISPAGRFLILHNGASKKTAFVDDSRHRILIDTECLRVGSHVLPCSTTLSSFEGMRLLRWTPGDAAVFAIKDGVELVKLDLSGNWSIAERVRVDGELAATVVAGGTTPQPDITAEANELDALYRQGVRHMRRTELAMQVPVTTAPGAALVEDGDTGEISLLLPEGRAPLAYFSPQFDRPALAFTPGRNPPYTVEDGGVSIVPVGGPGAEHEFRAPSGRPLPYQDVAVAAAAGPVSASLSRSVTGAHALRWAIGESHGHLACNMPFPSLAESAISAEAVTIGTGSRPLTLLKITQAQSKGVAVFFTGGPGALILGRVSNHMVVLKLLESGRDVYIANYSGSLGEGPLLARRVAQEGPQSLSSDAIAIQRHLSETGVAQHHLLVYGESFGALPATELAALTGADLILLAPFIRHRDPAEWLPRKGSAMNPLNVPAQARHEQSMLAIPPRKAEWDSYLNALYRKPREGNSLIIFGKQDVVSKAADLPASQARTELKEVAGTHQGLSLSPPVLFTISAWLSERKP